MTHASVAPDERARLGITDNLIRISVGLEEEEDLLADIQQALDKAVTTPTPIPHHTFLYQITRQRTRRRLYAFDTT